MTITRRIVFTLLPIAALFVVGLFCISYFYSYAKIKSEAEQKIEAILESGVLNILYQYRFDKVLSPSEIKSIDTSLMEKIVQQIGENKGGQALILTNEGKYLAFTEGEKEKITIDPMLSILSIEL